MDALVLSNNPSTEGIAQRLIILLYKLKPSLIQLLFRRQKPRDTLPLTFPSPYSAPKSYQLKLNKWWWMKFEKSMPYNLFFMKTLNLGILRINYFFLFHQSGCWHYFSKIPSQNISSYSCSSLTGSTNSSYETPSSSIIDAAIVSKSWIGVARNLINANPASSTPANLPYIEISFRCLREFFVWWWWQDSCGVRITY